MKEDTKVMDEWRGKEVYCGLGLGPVLWCVVYCGVYTTIVVYYSTYVTVQFAEVCLQPRLELSHTVDVIREGGRFCGDVDLEGVSLEMETTEMMMNDTNKGE